MSDENQSVRIPEDAEVASEIALEGDEEEPRVTKQQRKNIAVTCAKLIGDID